jgi:hypothetical protein
MDSSERTYSDDGCFPSIHHCGGEPASVSSTTKARAGPEERGCRLAAVQFCGYRFRPPKRFRESLQLHRIEESLRWSSAAFAEEASGVIQSRPHTWRLKDQIRFDAAAQNT